MDHHQIRRDSAELPLGVRPVYGANGRFATAQNLIGLGIYSTDSAIGILFCDYWVVKRKRYDVPALYDPEGIYFYKVSIRYSRSDLCLN